jgi:hypothetical protein
MVAIRFMRYSLARILKTLEATPAMVADLTDHVCSLEEIGDLAGTWGTVLTSGP